MHFLLINGPNLNLLGKREPSIYGPDTLQSIESELQKKAQQEGIDLESFQSNSEGELVDRIQKAIGKVDAIMINAGAYTHTSVALRDALLSAEIPYVELHLSNTYARESFRQKSLLADRAIGIISGFGAMSYQLAFEGMLDFLKRTKTSIKSNETN
ncbi:MULTISPECIES: type II 3-dehydroquinate dehydratase [unclassified Prochlorococcus]|uniref:type II 3-dehydroquinate dehydratase n=1 Tax=unclassified Prochlorococcus TaxID=2627481 RepID=UPI0005669F78|nr:MULTISPECIES: type II 3-dehydroquinate dehydratase [unclassified Prochlorococcus]